MSESVVSSASSSSHDLSSEELGRLLAEHLPQPAWLARADGFITWYNRRWHEYTGTTPEQMRGWGWQNVHDPATLPHVLLRWRAAIETGEAFEMEFPLRGADGKFRPFLTRAEPVRDADGRILHWVGTNTEIAAQKETEAALRLSEARFRGTFENAAVGIAHVAPDGHFLRVNQTLSDITGYPREELLTKTFADLALPDELASDAMPNRRGIADEETRDALEQRYRRKDGTRIWVNLTRSALQDENGRVLYFIVVVQDISRRKAAELAIAETNERFQLISRATNDVLWDWNVATGSLWWSQGFESTFGDVESPTIAAWMQRIHPDDRDATVDHVQTALQAGRSQWHAEYRFRRADGSYARVSDRGFVLRDAAGEAVRMVGAMQDITERKLVEERLRENDVRLRLALEAAYLIAFVWDIPKNEVRRPHNAGELLGDTDAKPDTFEGVRARVHPDDVPVFDENVRAALADPTGVYRSEYRLVTASGEERWLLERGRVEFDLDRKPLRLIGVSQDITERKTAELQLIEAQQELRRHAVRLESAVAERTARLQEMVTELGAFSHSISHDLRAPLRAVQGFSEVLRDECAEQLSDSGRSYLDRIINATGKMDRLIRDVLEYSRMARAELTLETVDVADVVSDAIESNPQLKAPAAIVVVDPLPPAKASRPALLQCFSNLLGNAVKFVAPGVTPRVHVRAEARAGVTRYWIEDNGIGIDPRHYEKIWGMLERLNPRYEGTGVGLSIVRKAVERMGGAAGVESKVGEGSRFWIELPMP